MKVHNRLGGIAAVLLLAVAGIAGFLLAGSSANGATQSKGTVSLRSTKYGKVLVSSSGQTIYLFTKDRGGRSSCSGQCASYWPPLISASKPTAGTGVNLALLGRVKRSDGKMQVTYNKHPLYFFVKDKAAGQANGENLDFFGGEWYVVNAKGAKVEPGEHAGTTTGTTTTPVYTYNPPPGY